MNRSLRRFALAAGCVLFAGQLMAEPKRPECIAPASPGGGFDLTCKLAQSALVNEKLLLQKGKELEAEIQRVARQDEQLMRDLTRLAELKESQQAGNRAAAR